MTRTTGLHAVGRQFIHFTGVGAIGTTAHYATLIALVTLLDMRAVLASSAGALVGAFVNYYLNYHFTFKSTRSHREALSRFMIVAAVGYVVNGLCMALFTETLHIQYLLAQVITTGIVLIWTFTGNRLWTFAHPSDGT